MCEYMTVSRAAEAWDISERSVRNYCAQGRIPGAVKVGKVWRVPLSATMPARRMRSDVRRGQLLKVLRREGAAHISGGIYHRLQIDLTYNSNHIEGSRLTEDQTRQIFETRTLGLENGLVSVDDIIETTNHFRCVDHVIATAEKRLSQAYLKELHGMLKSGTQDAGRDWFAVGDYKRLPNEVGGRETSAPEDVAKDIEKLIDWYEGLSEVGLVHICDFHWRLECIHPFQDGNGRVGRLLMLKECLRRGVVPFVITEELKAYYYRGLREYEREPGYLEGTALAAQDSFKRLLDYFRIEYV